MTKKKTISKTKNLVIYQSKSGALELRGDFTNETVWATQAQIATAFSVNTKTVNEHIVNIYKTDELDEESTIRKFRIVQEEGRREVERNVLHYNLDTIISVGYRVNSKTATEFRKWATSTLRQHIVKGYTINRKVIARNYNSFIEAVEKVKSLLPADNKVDGASVLELVSMFADTWFSLDAYDKELLSPKKVNVKKVKLTADELKSDLAVLKSELQEKKEATENFAQERNQGSLEGIVGNVMQSFGEKAVYPSVQDKAAHLLYFIIKNHPFVDGNKRSGAYTFIWFLKKAKVLDVTKLTPTALTVLTILIAESDPKDKDKMIALVIMLTT